MKKILIAGTNSGSGKTTITLGILYELSKHFNVQPYKVGPDYIDTKFHSRITGNRSRNIDNFLVPDDQILHYLFSKETNNVDFGVVEGVMGLYDGLGTNKDAYSTASIAKKLKIPVVLVVNGKSSSTSVAAIVKGFVQFDSNIKIVGTIINNVMSEGHYHLIEGAIKRYVHVPVLGYLPYQKGISLPSRQLGLVPDNELPQIDKQIAKIGELVSKHVDLNAIMQLSEEDRSTIQKEVFKVPRVKLTLGVAFDEAFNFYYQDNLTLLSESGVKIKYFSPIHDNHLPEVDALYIGGGYPEEFAKELADNVSIKHEIKRFAESSKPIYAECGGLMYLGKTLVNDNKKYLMVGVFDGISKMTQSLKKFGYCSAIMKKDTILGMTGNKVFAHEFHHSIFLPNDNELRPVLDIKKVRDGQVTDKWQGGYQIKNTFASYLHVDFYQSQSFFRTLLKHLGACDYAVN